MYKVYLLRLALFFSAALTAGTNGVSAPPTAPSQAVTPSLRSLFPVWAQMPTRAPETSHDQENPEKISIGMNLASSRIVVLLPPSALSSAAPAAANKPFQMAEAWVVHEQQHNHLLVAFNHSEAEFWKIWQSLSKGAQSCWPAEPSPGGFWSFLWVRSAIFPEAHANILCSPRAVERSLSEVKRTLAQTLFGEDLRDCNLDVFDLVKNHYAEKLPSAPDLTGWAKSLGKMELKPESINKLRERVGDLVATVKDTGGVLQDLMQNYPKYRDFYEPLFRAIPGLRSKFNCKLSQMVVVAGATTMDPTRKAALTNQFREFLGWANSNLILLPLRDAAIDLARRGHTFDNYELDLLTRLVHLDKIEFKDGMLKDTNPNFVNHFDRHRADTGAKTLEDYRDKVLAIARDRSAWTITMQLATGRNVTLNLRTGDFLVHRNGEFISMYHRAATHPSPGDNLMWFFQKVKNAEADAAWRGSH